MTRTLQIWCGLVIAGAWLWLGPTAWAEGYWRVASSNHEQTFAYGSEQRRSWTERGRDRHLVVLMDFTNDPYVDQNHPREYDNFEFAFPGVTLGKDRRTFFYHTPGARQIPVAQKHSGFLGIEEIELLPNARLIVDEPHGYLSLELEISE